MPAARRNRVGRPVDHASARCVDFHRAPGIVAEVEIETPIELAHADMHRSLRRLEMRLRLDRVQRGLQGLRTRRAVGSSKKRSDSQRRNPLERIGQVSR